MRQLEHERRERFGRPHTSSQSSQNEVKTGGLIFFLCHLPVSLVCRGTVKQVSLPQTHVFGGSLPHPLHLNRVSLEVLPTATITWPEDVETDSVEASSEEGGATTTESTESTNHVRHHSGFSDTETYYRMYQRSLHTRRPVLSSHTHGLSRSGRLPLTDTVV